MKALIQRVKKASVEIDGKIYSQIKSGLLVFLGVSKSDTKENAQKLAQKVLSLRIFEDEHGKMNKSVLDVQGEILIVSQFTLLGDCKKGTRPSFDDAASPENAKKLYEEFVKIISDSGTRVKTGKFQAMMDVSLINDGPVTFMIEK
ncbi:MAG TPA: D-aminoacyl-tRNA deacylase [Candidatus Gastranaerophilaceae bacterium]|nr:D-aminoacyl-tRNA deacylase [Candidatus Gastranaerophilaceae bacterium]